VTKTTFRHILVELAIRNLVKFRIYVKCPSVLSDGDKKTTFQHILVELAIRNLVKNRYIGCRV
jgi:hypothetical protein